MTILHRSAKSLWSAGTTNFRVLAVTGILWTIPLSLTEPYRFLFCHRLGLSESALGWLVSADLVLRACGMLVSGWLLRRVGAKRLLVAADVLSWVVPYLLFATAQGPKQAGFSLVLLSINAFASTPYLCLLAEGAPGATRSRAFAFLNLCNILPGALLPWIAADLAEAHAFLPTLRWLFGAQALLMGVGIVLRSRILHDLEPDARALHERPSLARVLRTLVRSPRFRRIWPLLLFQGALQGAWNAWSAIYLTGTLGLPDRAPGWNAQISAAALALSSFLLLPRIPEHLIPRAAAISLVVAFLTSLAWLAPLPLEMVLLVGAIQGVCAGVHISALASLLADALPRRSRDHGFALSYVGVHLGVASLMALGGGHLETNPTGFPTLIILIFGLQAVVGAQLVAFRTRRASHSPAPNGGKPPSGSSDPAFRKTA